MNRMAVLVSLVILLVLGLGIAQAQEPVTIEYWNINTSAFGGPQVDALIASFEAANPDINVESRPKDRYPTIVSDAQVAIAGGNPPDVVQFGWPFLNFVASSLPYVSVETLIETYGGEETFANMPQNIYDLTLVNGEHVGVTYSLSNAIVYYNPDLFEQAGLDPENPPQTIEEWTEAAAIFREALDLPLLTIDYAGDNWAIENLVASNGGSLLICEEDGTYGAGIDTPEAIAALQTWADWVANGYEVNALDQARTVFWSGQAGALIWSIGGRGAVESNAEFEVRATTYPQFGELPTRLPTGGNMLVVMSQDEAKQEAAWRFIQYLLSEDGVTVWTEGTGYIPTNPALVETTLAEFYAATPIQQVATSQIGNQIVWTSFPGANGAAASTELFEAVQAALGGDMTAEAAFMEAAAAINELIGEEPCSAS